MSNCTMPVSSIYTYTVSCIRHRKINSRQLYRAVRIMHIAYILEIPCHPHKKSTHALSEFYQTPFIELLDRYELPMAQLYGMGH
jgi:hypothetical protein